MAHSGVANQDGPMRRQQMHPVAPLSSLLPRNGPYLPSRSARKGICALAEEFDNHPEQRAPEDLGCGLTRAQIRCAPL
eukprot:7385524-Prymnesium_polylepis.2